MPHLVEDRTIEQVAGSDFDGLPVCIRGSPFHLVIVPGHPVSFLGVCWKQQDLAIRNTLDGESEAGVVGRAVELKCEVGCGVEPVVVYASPGIG
jgi:hypothetical protein